MRVENLMFTERGVRRNINLCFGVYVSAFVGLCLLNAPTDNSTAKAAFWKGTSTSLPLFKLVLELKQLEMESDIILHVIHVSGKRMIAQGTDGLSRADHSEGVMQGKPIANFVPLHLDALEREPGLRAWLTQVTSVVPHRASDWNFYMDPCPGGG